MHLRALESGDYDAITSVVDAWWGGRPMRGMLPQLFFDHFRPTSFVAERDGEIAGFLIGFVSQTEPAVAYVHFVGVAPEKRGAGIGQALYEGVAYSEEGQLLTASYQDYCVPRADDIPPITVTLDDSAPCRTNPLGAKGCGESGAIGGPPCVANGVMDALSELGIKQLNTPLTPAKVWQAIRDARAGV